MAIFKLIISEHVWFSVCVSSIFNLKIKFNVQFSIFLEWIHGQMFCPLACEYMYFFYSLFFSSYFSQINWYDKRTAKLLEAIESRILQWFGFLFIFLDLGKHSHFCLSVFLSLYFGISNHSMLLSFGWKNEESKSAQP